jgi:hypothetical protein
MKRIVVWVLLATFLVIGLATAADDQSDKNSKVEQAKRFLAWMKESAAKLDQELLQARREQNAKKINCIADRLSTLKELIGESQNLYQKLRAYAMQQRIPEANKVFAKLASNQKVAEQLIKLVNECFRNINEPGGFVETLEEWTGELPDEDAVTDPTATDPRTGNPEPVPNEFTPGPVSEEEEE